MAFEIRKNCHFDSAICFVTSRGNLCRPEVYSITCGTHFTPECFEDDVKVKMGIKVTRNQLIPGFILAVFVQICLGKGLLHVS